MFGSTPTTTTTPGFGGFGQTTQNAATTGFGTQTTTGFGTQPTSGGFGSMGKLLFILPGF